MVDSNVTIDQLIGEIADMLLAQGQEADERVAQGIAAQIVSRILAAVEERKRKASSRWRHVN